MIRAVAANGANRAARRPFPLRQTLHPMKTRFLSAALAAVIVPTLHADTETVDGIEWTYSVSGGTVTVGIPWSKTAVPNATEGAIVIPDSLGGYPVTGIAANGFVNCSHLTSISMPAGLNSIGIQAFTGCSSLHVLSFPEGLTTIDASVFSSCVNLTTIEIPNSVSSLPLGYWNCPVLSSIVVAEDNPRYSLDDGILFSKDKTSLLFYRKPNGGYSIPTTVTNIGDMAFSGCTNLLSIIIPESVVSIGASAFSGCSGLSSLSIPPYVKTIGRNAFGWNSLRLDFSGPPPNMPENVLEGKQIYYSSLYEEDWVRYFASVNLGNPRVQILSSSIREEDPTVLDVRYTVSGGFVVNGNPTSIKVRALAFEDGERSFSKVVRPETFIEGTAENIGDNVLFGTENILSWKVSADWSTRLAKVKFEILVQKGGLVPLKICTIPAGDQYGTLDVSWNTLSDDQLFNALLWLYADKDEGLALANGVLSGVGVGTLAKGAELAHQRYSNSFDFDYRANAAAYIFAKMGYSRLSGTLLSYVNGETRLGLDPNGARQYAYKFVNEGE